MGNNRNIQAELQILFDQSKNGLEFENSVREYLNQVCCQELATFYEKLDQKLLEEYLSEGCCVERRDFRSIQTIYGVVTYKRRRYLDRNKVAHYYLDEKLGYIKGKRYSPLVIKSVAQIATKLTYRQAEVVLSNLTPITISAMGVRQLVLLASENILQYEKYQGYALKKPKKRVVEALYLEGDAVAIKQQTGEFRYLHRFQVHEGCEKFGQIKRCRNLKEFTSFRRIEAYQNMFTYLRNEYDLEKSVVIASSDGGPGYGPSVFNELGLGAKQYEYFLDKYHVNRKILESIKDRELSQKLVKAVTCYNLDRCKAIIDTYESIIVLEDDEQEVRKFNRLKKYLKRNWQYMKPWKLRNLEINRGGIGIVESHHRPYTYRMKKQGKSWGKNGEEAITKIITSEANKIYDEIQQKDWTSEIKKLDVEDTKKVKEYGKIKASKRSELGCVQRGKIPNYGPKSSAIGSFRQLQNYRGIRF